MKAYPRQRGVTTVEFAIVGLVLFAVLFAAVEFSRVVFTLSVLQEAARRGARVAVVCPMHDAYIDTVAKGLSKVRALQDATVTTDYLDQNGGGEDVPFNEVQYVRVTVDAGEIPLAIPLWPGNPSISAPVFTSTLPRESLGVVKVGATPLCSE